MLIWAWIFAIPFVAAIIDLGFTARASSSRNRRTEKLRPLVTNG